MRTKYLKLFLTGIMCTCFLMVHFAQADAGLGDQLICHPGGPCEDKCNAVNEAHAAADTAAATSTEACDNATEVCDAADQTCSNINNTLWGSIFIPRRWCWQAQKDCSRARDYCAITEEALLSALGDYLSALVAYVQCLEDN